MKKFRIEMTGPCTGRVWIDGEEVHGIRAVSFKAEVNQVTEVTLTMTASQLVASGDEAEVTEVSDTERRFAKAGA